MVPQLEKEDFWSSMVEEAAVQTAGAEAGEEFLASFYTAKVMVSI